MPKYSYSEPDRYLILNQNDKNLFPIKIDLLDLLKRTYRLYNYPEPTAFPDPRRIKGYGDNPADQIFEREVIPQELINLEREVRNDPDLDKLTNDRRENTVINNFWKRLEAEPKRYADVIEFINHQWYFRLFGYFFYCNGKCTYITGVHWFFLNYWHLFTTTPEYRNCDREWYIAMKYFQTTTETFKHIDKISKKPIPNADGEYEMIDTGYRTFYGVNDPKNRRAGDTSKAQCDNTEFATRTQGVRCGIQGMSEDNASTVFQDHFLLPFQQLPIFFKPLCQRHDPSERMIFKGDDNYSGLNTRYDFATSQERSSYDGKQIFRLHVDEAGKAKKVDVSKRQETVKYTLGLGRDIFGFQQITTTCEEMDRDTGMNYLKLTKQSYFDQRDENGQTLSGLATIFWPAYMRYQTYIGKYGESVWDKPTPDQSEFLGGTKIGAKEYLENKRNAFMKAKDYEGLTEFIRMMPFSLKEVFTPPARNNYFRIDLITDQLEALTFGDKKVRRGRLEWEGDRDNSRIVFLDDEEEGRFVISKNFLPSETNLKEFYNGTWYPKYFDKYVASADTFRVEKSEGGKMSDGAGCVRWRRDYTIDPEGKPIEQWESSRTVIDYLARPDLDDYLEDMLKMCVYSGAMMYPEANQDAVEKYFIKRGYRGYLLYQYEEATNHYKAYAGFYTGIDLKKKMFIVCAADVAKSGKRNWHENILRALLEVKGLDDITNHDAFVSYAGTLLAEEVSIDRLFVGEQTWTDDWIKVYTY